MEFETINYETDENIAIITLNRPEKLNALNTTLRDELGQVCAHVYRDDDVRAVVLTGAGRGFCSGADISGPLPSRDAAAPQNTRLDEMGWVGRLATSIYEIGVPSIAAMNGVAAGAGMSIALACDMRVGHSGSRFRTVFAERGLSPDTGMSYFLPRIIGYARAADLIFTSRDIGGDEAYRLGLLDRLVAAEEVLNIAIGIAKQISQLPPMAIRSGKRVLQQNMERGFHEALRNETVGLQFASRAPQDRAEQRSAFLDKRKPTFTGT